MLQVLVDGPNVNWDVLKIHSSYREENEFSNWHTPRWQLWPSCVIWCPGHRTDGNRLGDQQSFTCNIENIQWITCKERYITETVCDIFSLHFARPDGLRMNLLLHKESMYGKAFYKKWSPGFHCQKVNDHIITNNLIPWSSTIQINW